jgi:hypothetical protein
MLFSSAQRWPWNQDEACEPTKQEMKPSILLLYLKTQNARAMN